MGKSEIICKRDCFNCQYEDCISTEAGIDYASESYREYRREYYKKNKDRIRAYSQAYRDKNREKLRSYYREYQKKYYAAHKAELMEKQRLRRNKRKNLAV